MLIRRLAGLSPPPRAPLIGADLNMDVYAPRDPREAEDATALLECLEGWGATPVAHHGPTRREDSGRESNIDIVAAPTQDAWQWQIAQRCTQGSPIMPASQTRYVPPVR